MQEHEMGSIEEITEGELESITGGCNDCATDLRIIDAAEGIARSAEILRANGAEVPDHIMTRADRRQAYTDSVHAMQRVNQRHPGTYNLPPGIDEALNRMNQRQAGRRNP